VDTLALQLIIMAILGIVVAVIASQRGRNPLGWFFIGLIAGCIGLILVLVLPDLKQQRARDEADRKEKRRLRELLAQERMKNQSFRGHTSQRLDAHDRVLGVDTRLGSGEAPARVPLPPPPPDEDMPSEGWYVARPGGQSEGPLSLLDVRGRVDRREVRGATLVWHESLDDWMPLNQSPLRSLL
jgi:hypothetical protein